MNDCNFTGIRMKKSDWKRIPSTFRKLQNGVWMILAGGEYRPVLIVG